MMTNAKRQNRQSFNPGTKSKHRLTMKVMPMGILQKGRTKSEKLPQVKKNKIVPENLLTENEILLDKSEAQNEQLIDNSKIDLFDNCYEVDLPREIGDFENAKLTKIELGRLKLIDLGCLTFTLISLGLSSMSYDLEFELFNANLNDQDKIKSNAVILLWVILITSFILWYLTYLRYTQKLKFKKSRLHVSVNETLWSSGLVKDFILEFILLTSVPLPFFVGNTFTTFNDHEKIYLVYNYNDILYILSLLKVFIIIRVLFDNTYYYSNRAQRLWFHKQNITMYGAQPGLMLCIKCFMKETPFRIIFPALLGSIVIFGFAIRVCERPLSREFNFMNFSTYQNSMWCMILTITTVGYGDIYPRTLPGRLIVFLVSLWGVSIVSIMVVSLTNILTLDSSETKALNVLNRLGKKDQVVEEAAYMIQMLGKYRLAKKYGDIQVAEQIFDKIRYHAQNFKEQYRQMRNFTDMGNINEEISTSLDMLKAEFDNLQEKQGNIEKGVNKLVEGFGLKKSLTKITEEN